MPIGSDEIVLDEKVRILMITPWTLQKSLVSKGQIYWLKTVSRIQNFKNIRVQYKDHYGSMNCCNKPNTSKRSFCQIIANKIKTRFLYR